MVEGRAKRHRGTRCTWRWKQTHAISWRIDEDIVAKQGVPREIVLPLIVVFQGEGRFSARVTVGAHYGFWRGVLARKVPVLGHSDKPLFFDPSKLTALVTLGQQGLSNVHDPIRAKGYRLKESMMRDKSLRKLVLRT